jgi:hyaluronan synthase
MNSVVKFFIVLFGVVGIPVSISIFVKNQFALISVYGLCLSLYSFVQILFSYLNRGFIERITKKARITNRKYNILVVGYKEDPILFRRCLESMKMFFNNPKIEKILVVIDGDTQEDQYMVDIFNQVFQENSKKVEGKIFSVPEEKALCITQEHEGKRSVLYTGLRLSIIMNVYGVICTDSDTIFHKDVVSSLTKVLEHSDEIGAVSGNVEILNKNTIISYLSHLRYWFSCNIERAYQSYNGCVMCVSGPLGVYRTEYFSKILDDWYTQEFLGERCTYGDDRHLTNNILMLGKKVLYTHLATCYTDTPESVNRFFTQQVRWCKSSYREVIWTMKCLNKHSFFMCIDLIYQSFYSIAVFAGLIYILTLGTLFQTVVYFALISFFNSLKGIYAFLLEKDLKYLTYGIYGFVYIFILVPARIYAGITLKDIGWGTSSRNLLVKSNNLGHYILYAWDFLLVAGIILKLVLRAVEWNILNISIYTSYISTVALQTYCIIKNLI